MKLCWARRTGDVLIGRIFLDFKKQFQTEQRAKKRWRRLPTVFILNRAVWVAQAVAQMLQVGTELATLDLAREANWKMKSTIFFDALSKSDFYDENKLLIF